MEPLAALDLEALIAQDGYILGHAVLGTDRLDDTATYSWTSLVDEATSISVTRGGSSPGLVPRIDVGTLVATFVDGADPIDDPRLRPGTPLRLAARAGGELLDVYRSAFTATSVDGWQHANPVWMPAGTAYNGTFWGLRWWRGLRRIVRVTETGALHLSWIDQLAEGTGLTYAVLIDGDEVARITPGTDWAARSLVVEGLRSGDVELQFQPLDPVDTRRLFIAEVHVRAEGRAPVFTGSITEVAMTEDRDGHRLMTLTAADGIASLSNTQRYGAVSTGAELWSQRIARLAKSATTPIALPGPDFDDWGAPLADVVYESTLTNHFDLACHSVGARWWVDRTNVVRFEREKIALPLAAHFSDIHARLDPLHACYTDLSLAFDVASAVNNISVTNHGRRYDPDQDSWLADDVVSIHTDTESIQRWGARSESIDLSLAEPTDVQKRAAQLLKASATPLVRPTSLTFDALHDSRTYALARSLEPYDRVTVTRSGRTYPARISGISHQVTTSSWLTTLTLREDT